MLGKFNNLKVVFDMSKNYLNYRTTLQSSIPPLVPYLGIPPLLPSSPPSLPLPSLSPPSPLPLPSLPLPLLLTYFCYVGLYPKDLFAIEENLSTRTTDQNLIAVTKLRKLHEIIRPLLDYQLGKNYVIKSDRVVHQFLKNLTVLGSEEIHQYLFYFCFL